jgi:hypothetical protein
MEYAEAFKDGFLTAVSLLRGSGAVLPKGYEDPPDYVLKTGESITEGPEGADDGEFLTIIQNNQGKRIRFNKRAARMLDGYSKADIWTADGRIYIYPTNEGRFAITRAPSNGQTMICCSTVIDDLSKNGKRYRVQKKDNHLVAVEAV